MIFRKPSAGWMLVGLGNPGSKYARSRHNTGFRAIDALCERQRCRCDRLRLKALTGFCELGGEKVLLVKPMTYMNLSGQAVRPLADYYKIPPEHILVIFDDVSLPVGKLRVRPDGSAGGHNGIKSLIAELGSQSFPRIKIGVGEKPHPDYDLADWVLSSFSPQEEKALAPTIERALLAAEAVIAEGTTQAMNRFNGN
jgi:PTH1 family peptidyl-tRNA hydrolase